jgi:hypothetical protein
MLILIEFGLAWAVGVLVGTLMTVHYGSAFKLREKKWKV